MHPWLLIIISTVNLLWRWGWTERERCEVIGFMFLSVRLLAFWFKVWQPSDRTSGLHTTINTHGHHTIYTHVNWIISTVNDRKVKCLRKQKNVTFFNFPFLPVSRLRFPSPIRTDLWRAFNSLTQTNATHTDEKLFTGFLSCYVKKAHHFDIRHNRCKSNHCRKITHKNILSRK